jgi:hypothetical protein
MVSWSANHLTAGDRKAPKLAQLKPQHTINDLPAIQFDVMSIKDGQWSDSSTWRPARVPRSGDRVRVSRGTRIVYDINSDEKIRFIQIVGTLTFARDRDTTLNVGILKVQNSDECSENGFACDLHSVNASGEPHGMPAGEMATLEIGTSANPIPAKYTARIRLHYFSGMNKNDAPALACCSARLDLHGSPLSLTWTDLGADVAVGDQKVTLASDVTGWRIGDDILVTSSVHHNALSGNHRYETGRLETEERRIKSMDGRTITLDRPLKYHHVGSGDFRSEVANLTRNVIIESADPKGVRGHTIAHRFSSVRISYARFAHLGKEGVLGRYAIHFHLLGDTNRGGSVVGAAIVDSHNRWITVHGTNHLIVRDCIGYRSVGHGFFLEDGTEVDNVFDRNLGVQAFRGKRLPKQVLPFDPNDGAAFWWSNGRNTFIRNTSCENDRYGFRYDSQKRSNFDSNLMVKMPNGKLTRVDIRTIPIYRFENNEAHSEGLYGIVIAGTDRVAPDRTHPHKLKNLKIWQVHYALRPEVPNMLIEGVKIDHAVYGIYRPEFENHAYKDLYIGHTSGEPFNRGLDDRSLQNGPLTVDGLTFDGFRNNGIPLIQISADNPNGTAVTHLRNVKIINRRDNNRRALINLGGGPRRTPSTPHGVPIYIHDYYGPGKHAKVVSTRAKDLLNDGNQYREERPLTGDESRVATVTNVKFPQLFDDVDDQPPATVVTFPAAGTTVSAGKLIIRGTTTDNSQTARVLVNNVEARSVDANFYQWEVVLNRVKPGKLRIKAVAIDATGNREMTPHELTVVVR